MSDLVERVAAAIAATAPTCPATVLPWHRKQARAAIRAVIDSLPETERLIVAMIEKEGK